MLGVATNGSRASSSRSACSNIDDKSKKIDSNVILTFGVIADIQYSTVADAYNFSKTKLRRYRNSLKLLEGAVNKWLKIKPPLDFVLQLGDIIDGNNKNIFSSEDSLDTVIEVFDRLPCTVLHVLGNHEFYNFSRQQIKDTVLYSANLVNCESESGCAYYTHRPHPRLLIVALDTYEISVLGYTENDQQYKLATEILKKHNPNNNKNFSDGMSGINRRFVQFNGGVSKPQLEWLERTLEAAANRKINVVIIGHDVAYEKDVDELCLCWSCDTIMNVLAKYSECVVCYMAGHDHLGGYAVDEKGIHHVTFPAIVETEPDNNAFGIGRLYKNKIEITGVGRVPSYKIPLRYSID